MTLAMTHDRHRVMLLSLLGTLVILAALLATARLASAANVVEEERPMGGPAKEVEEGDRSEKVVVVPEPPHWSGWGEHRPRGYRSAPRIRVWVDRGEWSTYEPGDRLWVYFRVDRPCFVTILDYSPDGRVETVFPSRWSGSNYVGPGRTYRVPESRRYSLRIAGSGGIETLVACAHEVPWPSGPDGVWIPRHHPGRGRVVVGRPGDSPPPGWRGRIVVGPWSVVVGPGRWPVPPPWYDTPERWSCDSVSFYVADEWRHGPGWYDDGDYGHGDCYGGGYGGPDDWDRGDEYYGWDDYYDWDDDGRRGTLVSDHFRMNDCSDRYTVGFDMGGGDAKIGIECVESERGDPTEVVCRLTMDDHWGETTLFRIDVEGEHGERPHRGRVYTREFGPTRVEVEVTGFKLAKTKEWQIPRFARIDFDVRVYRG